MKFMLHGATIDMQLLYLTYSLNNAWLKCYYIDINLFYELCWPKD